MIVIAFVVCNVGLARRRPPASAGGHTSRGRSKNVALQGSSRRFFCVLSYAKWRERCAPWAQAPYGDGRGEGALRRLGAGSFPCAAPNLWPQERRSKTHAPNKPCAPPFKSPAQQQKGRPEVLRPSGCPPDAAESRVPPFLRERHLLQIPVFPLGQGY